MRVAKIDRGNASKTKAPVTFTGIYIKSQKFEKIEIMHAKKITGGVN
jgi:hypothetical protein